MSHKAWTTKIAIATLLFLGLVVFAFVGRKLRRDFLRVLRRGQARVSGFSSSFFSMAFCWRTASRDCSIRLAPRRIKSEVLSG